jgi:CRP-like cAMP-binding protein
MFHSIITVMLTGIHPFDPDNDRTDAEIINSVLGGEVQTRSLVHSAYTAHLSPDALEVIEGLMQWHPEQRWTADRLLQNPWVRGKTASSKKMKQSDKRLAAYRKHKTRLERSFFRAMLDNSNSRMGTIVERKASSPSNKSSVLESAFRILEKDEAALAAGGAEQHPSLTFAEMTDLLSDNMKEVYFAKGHEIYKEGDEGHAMYFIVSGAVDVSSQEGFQKQRTAGEFVGSGALMHDTKTRRSSVRCTTHVHALEISREYFEKYVKSDEEVHLTMAENDRLRRRERVRTLLGLQKNMKSEHYQSNDVIVKKGQTGDALYIVEDGIVELSVDGHKVRTLKKGEMTGEHAAYYKGTKPYNASARCISDQCKLSTLQAVDLHKVLSSNPTLRDSFHDIMIRRDFVMAMVAATKRPFPETVEELRTAFDIIDLDKSNEIKDFELRKIMLDFDPSYSEKDLEVMLNSLDLNHSGTMSWSEFKKIFGMANDS